MAGATAQVTRCFVPGSLQMTNMPAQTLASLHLDLLSDRHSSGREGHRGFGVAFNDADDQRSGNVLPDASQGQRRLGKLVYCVRSIPRSAALLLVHMTSRIQLKGRSYAQTAMLACAQVLHCECSHVCSSSRHLRGTPTPPRATQSRSAPSRPPLPDLLAAALAAVVLATPACIIACAVRTQNSCAPMAHRQHCCCTCTGRLGLVSRTRSALWVLPEHEQHWSAPCCIP